MYICDNSNGIGNLRRHTLNCSRRDTSDVRQLLLSQPAGSTTTWYSKIHIEKLHELLVVATIIHDLSFQFVEHESIKVLFSYMCRMSSLFLGIWLTLMF